MTTLHTMRLQHAIWLGSSLLGLAVLLAFVHHCGSGTASPDHPQTPVARTGGNGEVRTENVVGPTRNPPVGPSTPAQAAPAHDTNGAGDTATASGGDSAVARATRANDAHDLAFLSRIETEMRRSPPPEILELVRMRHAGASRATLERAIVERLPADFALRAAARAWLRAAFPDPNAASVGVDQATEGTTSKVFGQGNGERRVRGFTKQTSDPD